MKAKMFLLAMLVLLGAGAFAPSADARTIEKCDDSIPPVCEKSVISGRRNAFYFFQRVGLDVSREEAMELWGNREIRTKVMALWRAQTFGR